MLKIKYLKPRGISLICLFPALSIISNPVYLKDYTLESFKKLQEKKMMPKHHSRPIIRISGKLDPSSNMF